MAASPEFWRADTQGRHVMALCAGPAGQIWVGTEDQGVQRYERAGGGWTRFTTADGLGDDNGYALALDRDGRLWVGHRNHGVSVFDGRAWRNFDELHGPLGARVFAIVCSPLDGDVWMATEAGLAHWQRATDQWSWLTRADRLPASPVAALAFEADGALWLGSQCDGVIAAGGTDAARTGWPLPPTVPTGEGLPSDCINALLVSRDGTLYAGTDRGLAWRGRDGRWGFRRGADWVAKLRGLTRPLRPRSQDFAGDLLSEDYVTALAEDAAGRLWVGHRKTGYEVFDPRTGRRVATMPAPAAGRDYVSAILPRAGRPTLVGWYGAGLTEEPGLGAPTDPPAASPAPAQPAALPSPAAAPTDLADITRRAKALDLPLRRGEGAWLGEDWTTQGDWVGRYGRQYAVLCAVQAPLDQTFTVSTDYAVEPRIGPHRGPKDSLRHWIHWLRSKDPRVLYNPALGYRRQADWDDHGETYPAEYEGPDLWVKVSAPEGLHRISLYFFNKDGHDGPNRWRDYLVELRPDPGPQARPDEPPVQGRARVRDFWGGVYEQFLIRGPGTWQLRVAKNGSLNAILQAVFIDKLTGPPRPAEALPLPWLDGVRLVPGPPTEPASGAAGELWRALDAASERRGGAAALLAWRKLAYRAGRADGLPDRVLRSWRFDLPLWTGDDRRAFDTAMQRAWRGMRRRNKGLRPYEDAKQKG